MNYRGEIVDNARRLCATEEMLAILQEGYADDEDMRRQFPVITPLYLRRFDAVTARRLLESVIIKASGRARDGELAACVEGLPYSQHARVDDASAPFDASSAYLLWIGRIFCACAALIVSNLFAGS
jgi:hypothetical protein